MGPPEFNKSPCCSRRTASVHRKTNGKSMSITFALIGTSPVFSGKNGFASVSDFLSNNFCHNIHGVEVSKMRVAPNHPKLYHPKS